MDISFILFYVIINLIPPHINHCEVRSQNEKSIVIEKSEDYWQITIVKASGNDTKKVIVKHNLYTVLKDTSQAIWEDEVYDLHDFVNIKKINWQKTDKVEVTTPLPIKAFWIERQGNLYKIRVETENGEDKNLEMSF